LNRMKKFLNFFIDKLPEHNYHPQLRTNYGKEVVAAEGNHRFYKKLIKRGNGNFSHTY
jgi:hypothetical protein